MAKSSKKKRARENRSPEPATSPSEAKPRLSRRFLTSAFGQAGVGALLLWFALPRAGVWPLAFVAPIPWILLIRRERLPGKRPYRAFWLVGFLFWLAELYWMTMPHPTTSIGWLALSGYLALLLPLFIGLSRVAVHRLGISVVVAAPVVWTGLELFRGYLWGGFTMASLGHAIYPWTVMIQTADIGGAYAVGFVVMFLAACSGRQFRLTEDEPRPVWPAMVGLLALAAVLVYGQMRMGQAGQEPAARIALVQGSTDITLGMGAEKKLKMHVEHCQLSKKAVDDHPDLDLIMWPESTYYDEIYSYEKGAPVPQGCPDTPEEFDRRITNLSNGVRQKLGEMAWQLHTPLLVGLTRRDFESRGEAVYNTAILVSKSDAASDTYDRFQMYDKIHLVMFGEYFPFADKLRFLYQFTPVNTLNIGLQAGEKPVAFHLNGLCLAPNICFESVIPQVIRRQVNELAAAGSEPDILVNLTNDGWFFGSNELDLHMICGVFRAVECRKPFLIAANTGLSAWIDGNGRIRQQGPRLASTVILADVTKDGRHSLYLWWGDLLPGICLLCCVVLAGVGWYGRRQDRKSQTNQ